MKKGSAALASNVVTLDMVHTLEAEPNLKVESGAGSPVVYVTFNVTDRLVKDKRVRQAVACAIDRQLSTASRRCARAPWSTRSKASCTSL